VKNIAARANPSITKFKFHELELPPVNSTISGEGVETVLEIVSAVTEDVHMASTVTVTYSIILVV